jgi:hypothetical protein
MARRERREQARKNKTNFVPQYNGRTVKTYEETYGKGYERFNSKFVTIKEIENN